MESDWSRYEQAVEAVPTAPQSYALLAHHSKNPAPLDNITICGRVVGDFDAVLTMSFIRHG